MARPNTTYTLRRKADPYEPCGCYTIRDIRKPPPHRMAELVETEFWHLLSQNGKFHNKGYDVYEIVDFEVCRGHGEPPKRFKKCEHGAYAKLTPLYTSTTTPYETIFHGDIKQVLLCHDRRFNRWACGTCEREAQAGLC